MNPTKNARGGINKISNKESQGIYEMGSTGLGGVEVLTPQTPAAPVAPPQDTSVPVDVLESAPKPTEFVTPTVEDGGTLAYAQEYLSSTDLANAEKAKAEQAAADKQATASQSEADLRGLMGIVSNKSQDQALYEDVYGVDEKTKYLNSINQQLRSETSRLQEFDKMTPLLDEQMRQDAAGRDITEGVYGAKSREFNLQRSIDRVGRAAKVEGLIAAATYAQGDLEFATSQVEKALSIKYDPIEDSIENEKFFLQRRWDEADAKEKEAIDARSTALTEELNVIKEAKTAVETAVSSGYATPQEIQELTGGDLSPDEVYAKANQIIAEGAQYDLNIQRQIQNQSLANSQLDAQIKQKELDGVDTETPAEFGNVVDVAAGLVGAERGKTTRKAITTAINLGDYPSAYALIANNVEESLTGEVKTKFANARTDYEVLSNVRVAIQEYADAGGDMSLLTGKAEEIKRKLGIDSGDASELAVQLWREFQTYRSNMTGAAFSAQESSDYASVNPTLGKELDLNLSVIDGAMNQLENRVTSTINTRVPGAEDLYGAITGEQPVQDGMSDEEAYQFYVSLQKNNN